jgi:hypothetical protein
VYFREYDDYCMEDDLGNLRKEFMLQGLVRRKGSDCMENMIITLSTQRIL